MPAQYLLPAILKRYNEKYPEEQLKILEMDSAKVVLRVIDHMVDVGLTGTTLEKKHCRYVPFYKDQLVVITPNTEKYRKLQAESADDISWICQESFIMREEGSGQEKKRKNSLPAPGSAWRNWM